MPGGLTCGRSTSGCTRMMVVVMVGCMESLGGRLLSMVMLRALLLLLMPLGLGYRRGRRGGSRRRSSGCAKDRLAATEERVQGEVGLAAHQVGRGLADDAVGEERWHLHAQARAQARARVPTRPFRARLFLLLLFVLIVVVVVILIVVIFVFVLISEIKYFNLELARQMKSYLETVRRPCLPLFRDRLSSCRAARTRRGSATSTGAESLLADDDSLVLNGENGSAGATFTVTIGLLLADPGDRTTMDEFLEESRGSERRSRRTRGRDPKP